MVEFMNKCLGIVHSIFKRTAHSLVSVVTADGKYFFGLACHLPVRAIVSTPIGKTNDDTELLCRFRSIELGVPILVKILHHVLLVCLKYGLVESLVLLVEFVEAGIGIELIEPDEECINFYLLPTLFEVTLFSCE